MLNKRNNKIEKILFIVPPCLAFDDFVRPAHNVKSTLKNGRAYGSLPTDMPLGVLSLSGYVKNNTSVETKLLDFNVVLNTLECFDYSSFTEFFRKYLSLSEFVDYKPTIIGLSTLFAPSYRNMLDIIKSCRDIFPDAIIIAGGGVPQNVYVNMFKEVPELNAICYGEGEKPLLGLLKAKDKLSYFEESSSWITRNKIECTQFKHDFIEDLDEIPFYDYDLCRVEDYDLNPGHDGRIEAARNFPVMTSRGCPYKCTFCASHTVHGRKMRYHSLDYVNENLKLLKEKYCARTLVFQDDCFLLDKKRAHDIINMVRELGFNAVFQNGLNLYALDRKMLEAMSEVGIKHLTLPVESGSQRVLTEIIRKPLKLEIIERVANDCRSLGIYTNANLLIGMPGETKKDIEDTRKFLKKLNVNWIGFLIATPLAGSEMLDVCLKKGYLRGDYLDVDFKKPIIETEHFTPDYISKTVYAMNLEINFVENVDYRLGEYKKALMGFENAIKAKSDHAFAHYYAGKCYQKLGDAEKAQKHLNAAKKIIAEQPFWKEYADVFNVEVQD